MDIGNGLSGNVSLPYSSNTPYTAISGIVSVNAEDVPLAQRAGWKLLTAANQAGGLGAGSTAVLSPYPNNDLVKRMIPGPGSSDALLFPDGSSPNIQVINGVGSYALVVRQWVPYALSQGWVDASFG
jgi:hypothetical protein